MTAVRRGPGRPRKKKVDNKDRNGKRVSENQNGTRTYRILGHQVGTHYITVTLGSGTQRGATTAEINLWKKRFFGK